MICQDLSRFVKTMLKQLTHLASLHRIVEEIIDELLFLLPENTVIREGENGLELMVLNKSTVDAINAPMSDYTEYKF